LRQLGDNWKPILTTAAAIGVGVGLTVLTVGTGAGPALLLASTILSATASSATSGVLGSALNGGRFGDCFLAGVKGAISGGATAMATGGTSIVGDFFGHNVGSVGTELLRAGSHATLSGLMYTAQGGNFEEGFAVGAVSSLVGSGLQTAGVGPVLGILSSGAVGAGTAALMGGDPVKGFFQGAAIGALNHYRVQPDGRIMWEGPEATIIGHHTILGHTAAWWARSSGAINQVNVEFDVILGARLIYNAATAATNVYRVFGEDSRAQGFSWTTENPNTIDNFRNAAGLPSGGASGFNNSAQFMIEGKVNTFNIINIRPALPLDGNIGGLRELIINPQNVRITNFSILKQ